MLPAATSGAPVQRKVEEPMVRSDVAAQRQMEEAPERPRPTIHELF
jgi:hypothetical protein